ncbi:hypothetical protein ACTGJ9_013340 [Bradyrhizobium sp. RDM12]
MRMTHFFRAPDRPESRFVKTSRRTPQEVKRAQGRMRTARWRADMDSRKAPTAQQVGLALAVALATTEGISQLSLQDMQLVQRALHHLRCNGFDIAEAKKTMRRLRRRLVDPLDRRSAQMEAGGEPACPNSHGETLF